MTANHDGTFNVQGSNAYASPGTYAVRVLITHLSDGQTDALNATVVVNSSTDSGPAFPNPAYPGQGGSGRALGSVGGSGLGTTNNGSHHGKHHAKAAHKPAHAVHAKIRHHASARPAQPARKLGPHVHH